MWFELFYNCEGIFCRILCMNAHIKKEKTTSNGNYTGAQTKVIHLEKSPRAASFHFDSLIKLARLCARTPEQR